MFKNGDRIRVKKVDSYKCMSGPRISLYNHCGVIIGLYEGAKSNDVYIVHIHGVRNPSVPSGNFLIRDCYLEPLEQQPKFTNAKIKHVSFNKKKGITHIVFTDGDKVKVTCQKGDKFDKRQGILNCIAKKFFERNSAYNDIIKELVEKGEDY